MRGLLFRFLALMGLSVVSACAVDVGASEAEISSVAYHSDEAPYIAVVTMVDSRDGRGAHTAVLVNASQRVIYDPAGTFHHPDLAERGDVHFGMDDRLLDYYNRYHARQSHFVHTQKIKVSPAVAEWALARVEQQGASRNAFCTVNATQFLQDVPGFETVRTTLFPEKLRRQIAALSGVTDSYVYENDIDKTLPVTQ